MHSTQVYHHDSPERQRVSIGHLPVELIIMIFREVHKFLAWWPANALALVCSAWREILSSVPSFWTGRHRHRWKCYPPSSR
ncbi:hypothetical protein BDN67DRAFT_973267 [Paxillus ammoniavirescens]|nr:hypothetical protein BDN67DRAFT_973267 [Paxillus ammoniavirescens]